MRDEQKQVILHRLARASETLEDARLLSQSKRWNSCVNRLYYACFYAVSALLLRDGFSSSKHTGIRSLFNQHYVKPETIPKHFAHLYNDLFEWRHEGDYEDFIGFQESQVNAWLVQVEKFIEYISQLIHNVPKKC
jgi:uncharacterized protein (UPF0332 family)